MDAVSSLCYEIIGLDEVFISYAGIRSPGTRIHKALSSLHTGSSLSLRANGRSITLRTGDGVDVASLSSKSHNKWEQRLDHVQKAEIKAIVTRYKDEGEPLSGMPIRSDSWEIPIVEAVWRDVEESRLMVAEEQSAYVSNKPGPD
jgi:ATP-dependent DNA helicase RecQ